jgi:spermidine synthase
VQPSTRATPLALFFGLFIVSGFAGLIYQSIWSHYLKLFLGHAAYAQTLVLIIFMGGLAIGAWLIGRFTHRIQRPIFVYAVVEVAIGVMALVFHKVFVATIDVSYSTVLPQIAGSGLDIAYKWLLAALLILPQSILLGTTFPLMSGGLIRCFPALPGASVAGLYFTNSFGAAIGVLIAGFYLINHVGLPGTLLTAGLLNILLAGALWILSKRLESAPSSTADAVTPTVVAPPTSTTVSIRTMLVIALVTGAITFVYEIAWVRMLSLVLGSSTHSFELMLSSMILGIALGSLWVKRRIDGYNNLLIALGVILCLKGIFAMATLPLYLSSFDVIQLLFHTLNKSEFSYDVFNATGQAIAMLVMVPAAFFAGMSLPLITMYLYRAGHGESAIGRVYAWNTLGAIIGVVIAVHIGLVYLGVKSLVVAAALVDIAIAIALIATSKHLNARRVAAGFAGLSGVVLVLTITATTFDPLRLASGIYRDGNFYAPTDTRVIFERDGKTARITVLEHNNGTRTIGTNGKTDASIQMGDTSPAESDEYTMTLAAAVPLAYKPDAKRVANIGFGSGLTTHVLLGRSSLERVDSIEIEPMMVEGAKLFGERVKRAYQDPRSQIHIDDAKSFFATQSRGYDIIISEPSNPWISGVATLFSDEFYQRIRTHLNDDGVLVQWIQLYEIDLALVASIMKAVDRNFGDYAIYDLQGSEMLLVATKNKSLPALKPDLFKDDGIRQDLARLGIADLSQLASWRLGQRATLAPLFRAQTTPMNSDYFPFVDQNAARARFLQRKTLLGELLLSPVPVIELLEQRPANALPIELRQPRPGADALRQREQRVAYRIQDYVINGTQQPNAANLASWQLKVAYFNRGLTDCKWLANDPIWSEALFDIGTQIARSVAPADAADVWRKIETSSCASQLSEQSRALITLFKAVNARTSKDVLSATEPLWLKSSSLPRSWREYVLEVRMAAAIADKRADVAIEAWNTSRRSVTAQAQAMPLTQQLLLAHLAAPSRQPGN